jgi:ankyrin repeat protein
LEALRWRIPGTIARALKELPQTLDETYEQILLGIDEDSQEYAFCLFQCLCVSICPLRLAELAEVLSVHATGSRDSEDHIDWCSEDSQQALLSGCSSLITVVDIDGSPVVQFAPFSVREYLISDRLASVGGHHSCYHVLPHLSYTMLMQASLNILLSLGDHVDKGVVEEQHPLAIYGAQYWVDQAKFGTVLLAIQDLLDRLFDRNRPCFAAWVWIYDFDNPFRGQMETTRPEQQLASPLYYAALCGFPSIIEHLAVIHPQDVFATGGVHVTLLNAALNKRNIDVVRTLLAHSADVNVITDEGVSPLHLASLSGHRDAVQLLLEHEAYVDIAPTYNTNLTPLFIAAFYDELEVCRLLVEHEAQINPHDVVRASSTLHAASTSGRLDIVKFLLDNGASIDLHDEDGQTALVLASEHGRAEVVRVLIKSGADVASHDDCQATPLSQASKHAL